MRNIKFSLAFFTQTRTGSKAGAFSLAVAQTTAGLFFVLQLNGNGKLPARAGPGSRRFTSPYGNVQGVFEFDDGVISYFMDMLGRPRNCKVVVAVCRPSRINGAVGEFPYVMSVANLVGFQIVTHTKPRTTIDRRLLTLIGALTGSKDLYCCTRRCRVY